MIVLCSKCTHLFCLKGLNPLCVACASPVPGPLRAMVDISGVCLAEARNENNDCQEFRRKIIFDRSAWIKKSLQVVMRAKGVKVELSSLKEYTIGEEKAGKETVARSRTGGSAEGQETESQPKEPWGLEQQDDPLGDNPSTFQGLRKHISDLAVNDLTQEEEPSGGTGGDAEVEEAEGGDGDRDDLPGNLDSGGEDVSSPDPGLDLHPGVQGSHRPRKDSV